MKVKTKYNKRNKFLQHVLASQFAWKTEEGAVPTKNDHNTH